MSALALNVGALSQAAPGFVSAWSGETARPEASVLNFAANDVRAAAALTPVSSTGRFDLFVLNSAFMFADAFGYFTK